MPERDPELSTGLEVGKGATVVSIADARPLRLAQLVRVGLELWPNYIPQALEKYLAPLLELGAPCDELERYMRQVRPPQGAIWKCWPLMVGNVHGAKTWLAEDRAIRLEKTRRAALAAAIPSMKPPAERVRLAKASIEQIEAMPSWETTPHAARPAPRRAFAPRAPTPAAPLPAIEAPEAAELPGLAPQVAAELRAAFRAQGVDPYGKRPQPTEPEKVGGLFAGVFASAQRPKL